MRCPVIEPTTPHAVSLPRAVPRPPSLFPLFLLFLLFLLVAPVPPTAAAASAESAPPDCRAAFPFAPATPSGPATPHGPGETGGPGTPSGPSGTGETGETGETGGPCRLRPGGAAVALVGSADAALRSPLRAAGAARPAAAATDGGGGGGGVAEFFWGLVTGAINKVRAYPWGNPSAIERFFFVRYFSLRFEMENEETMTGDTSRARFFNTMAFDRIRLISFTPLVADASDRLVCDYATVLSAQRTGMSSGQLVLKAFSSLSAFVFRSYSQQFPSASSTPRGPTGAYVVEELGPYRSSGLWLPSWLAVWFGRRPFVASEALVKHNRDDERGHYDSQVEFVFSAQVPAVTPVCLRLSVAEESSLIVHVEESLGFDSFWIQIILFLCFLRYVQPWIEESQTLQIFVAGLGGVVVICCFVIIFVLRSLQDMSLGKVGLITLLAIGGFSSVAEGLLSALSAVARTYLQRHEDFLPHTIMALLFLGVSCGLFAKFLWTSYLTALTQWTMRLLQMGIFLAATLQNREATFVFLLSAMLFRPSVLFRFIIWCSRSHALENFSNDPREVFPRDVRREVPYAKPLCVEGLAGSARGLNHDEKLHLYSAMGETYTQQALSRLAARVREDPSQYAGRLNNPKEVTRWANSFN